MKTAGFSALALVVALLLYVGSTGPVFGWTRTDSKTRNPYLAIYRPLTIFRETHIDWWLTSYIEWWIPGVRLGGVTFLSFVQIFSC